MSNVRSPFQIHRDSEAKVFRRRDSFKFLAINLYNLSGLSHIEERLNLQSEIAIIKQITVFHTFFREPENLKLGEMI